MRLLNFDAELIKTQIMAPKKVIIFSLLIILFLLIFSSVSSAQKNFIPNEEEKHLFKGIERGYGEIFTPVVNWPIKTEIKGDIYESLFEIKNLSTNKIKLEANSYYVISSEIKQIENKSYLKLQTSFSPQNGKMLAKVFYCFGVEQIILQDRNINIYKYAQEFKSVSHKELRKTRTYL